MTLPGLINIQEWRTTLGYGVHSPFAFNFIMSVLKEKSRYYAYDEIDLLAGNPRFNRLAFRIIQYFAPESVTISADSTSAINDVKRIARRESSDSKASGVAGNIGKMYIFDREKNADARQPGAGENYVALINLRKCRPTNDLLKKLVDGLDTGMTFTCQGKYSVVVASDELPRKDYKLRF